MLSGITIVGPDNDPDFRAIKWEGEISSKVKPTLDIFIGETEIPGHQSLVPTLEGLANNMATFINDIEAVITSHGWPQ